ncbi:MAG: hypothetical protein ABH886_03760 [Candidatus Desantisbacteria bacterium]
MLNKIKLTNKILFIIVSLFLLLCIILSLIPVYISEKGVQGVKATRIKLPLALMTPTKELEEYAVLSSGRLFGLIKQTPVESLPGIESHLITETNPPISPPEVTYHLQGVIQGSQGAIAIIKASNQAQNMLIGCNDTIDSYQAVRITKDSLVLKKDGQERILYLEYPH